MSSECCSAAQYAVQVALVTMKERCQKLQERLANLEKENAKLRAAVSESTVSSEQPIDENRLRDKVAELKSQKSHLTHQIGMVASENKRLFERLSRLTEANRSLGSHLSRISDTLNRHVSSPRPISPSDLGSVNLHVETDGHKEESLEEISSKLIQSILQAKADLQNQYDQMVELQSSEACSVRDLGFECTQEEDRSEALREAEETIRSLTERLALARESLKQQQTAARALLAAYRDRPNPGLCSECEAHRQEQNQLDSLKLWGSGEARISCSDDVQQQLQQVAEPPSCRMDPEGASCDRMCPLCARVFGPEVPFSEFEGHVIGHFPSPSDDESGDDAVANFEVVPLDVGF